MPTQGEGRPRVVTMVVIAVVVVGLVALTGYFVTTGLERAQQIAGVLALYVTAASALAEALRRWWVRRRPPPLPGDELRSEGLPAVRQRPDEYGPRRLAPPLVALAACVVLAALAWSSTSTTFRICAVLALCVLLPLSMLTWAEAYGPGSARLSQLVSRFSRFRIDRYERAYADYVRDRVDISIDAALTRTTGSTVLLRDVFVEAKLARSTPQRARVTVLPSDAAPPAGGPRSFDELLAWNQPRVLAVLGAPGAGKTSLLQMEVHRIATEGRRRRSLPVLLFLRQHVDRILRDAPRLSDLIADAFALDVPEPPGWWEDRLRIGRAVVLFDGLDEVGSDAARDAVVTWVESQVRRYRRNRFVLTSRPAGYRENQLKKVDTFEIQPFDRTQIDDYLRNWFRVVLRADGKASDDAAVRSAIERLSAESATNPELWELAASPLLLSMIAHVHYDTGRLPSNRAGLYRQICDVVLVRRRQEKELSLGRSGEHKVNVLARLGYTMVAANRPELPTADVLDAVRPALAEHGLALTPEDFLGEPGVEDELLQEIEVGKFGFAHRTIGEYLAGRYLHEHGRAEELAGHVEDLWWREPILLYLTDRSVDHGSARRRIVEACIERCTLETLSLVLELRSADVADDPELVDQLLALRDKAYDEATEPEQRLLIAGALVRVALRPLDSGGRTALCASPVGPELYLLYHRLTGAPAPPAPTRRAPYGAAIAGLWPDDVRRLLSWVNEVADGPRYRLPEAAELDAVAPRGVLPGNAPGDEYAGVWCRDPATDRLVLWTPHRHPHLVDAAEMESAVQADLGTDPDLAAIVTAIRTVGRLKSTDVDRFLRELSSGLGSATEAARKLGDLVRKAPPEGIDPDARVAEQTTLVGAVTDGLHVARTAAERLEREFGTRARTVEQFGRRSWPGSGAATIRAHAAEAARACLDGESRAANLSRALRERQDAIAKATAAAAPPWLGKPPKPLERRRLSELTDGYVPGLRRAQQKAAGCTGSVAEALPKALAAAFAALVHPDGPADLPAALRDVALLRALRRWDGGNPGLLPAPAMAAWLVRAAGQRSRIVDFDTFVATARRVAAGTGPAGGSAWLSAVARRFTRDCLAVANRERQLVPGGATRLRLAAIVLAASSDRSAEYHTLAAGITLLELRGRTRVPAEIVHLCRE